MTVLEDATNLAVTGVGVGILAAGAMVPIKMADSLTSKKKRKRKAIKFPKF